jgi:hypothetical protein
MKLEGAALIGVEYGNAWELRQPGAATNWIVGQRPDIPHDCLRFLRQDGDDSVATPAKNVCLKYFNHDPSDPPAWGSQKPTSEGRTLSLLAGDGAFEIIFNRGESVFKVLLNKPGDFCVWGEGLEHAWRPLAASTILTMRWTPQYAAP